MIKCWSDSKVAVGHINGEYLVKECQLFKNYHMFMRLKDDFKKVQVKHIDNDHNERDDKLARLVSDWKPVHLRTLIQETLLEPSIKLKKCTNVFAGEKGRMNDIFAYLTQGKLPKNTLEAKVF